MTEMKICTECGLEKPLLEYCKKKDSRDGHDNQCKTCRKLARTPCKRIVRPVSELEVDVSGTKQCKKCNMIKPKTAFNKKSDNKDKLEGSCRACRRTEQKRKVSQAFRPNLRQKVCKKCLKTKSKSEFFNRQNLKDGLSSTCKECMKTDKDEDKERRVKEQNKSGVQICQTCKEEAPIAELVGGLWGCTMPQLQEATANRVSSGPSFMSNSSNFLSKLHLLANLVHQI